MTKLLIATHNAGKKAEYAALLKGLDLELNTLSELGIELTIPEDGATFAQNAILKARGYAATTGLLTLADDSGLEVDALGGAPGVYTARYGGERLSDENRYQLLLENLRGVPDAQRTARFRCVIALAWPPNGSIGGWPNGRVELAEGTCEGRIAHEPHGEHGFGYDPVFYLPEFGCTMAELPEGVKNRISHRARAAAIVRELLQQE